MNRVLGLVLIFFVGVCYVQTVSSQNVENNREDTTLIALNSGFVFNDKLVFQMVHMKGSVMKIERR